MFLTSEKRGGLRKGAALALTGIIAAATLAGCGNGSDRPASSGADRATRAEVEQLTAKFTFGIKDGSGSPVDLGVVHERVLRACLRTKGITIPDPKIEDPPPNPMPELSRLDLWLARGEPLGLAQAVSDPVRLQQVRSAITFAENYREKPYPKGAEALAYGTPPQTITIPLPDNSGGTVTIPVSGCFGKATQDLYGVPAEKFERTRLALPRIDTTLTQTIADPAVKSRLQAYTGCMSEKGLKVENPAQISRLTSPVVGDVIKGTKQPTELVQVEQSAIGADAACKASSGLGSVFTETFIKHAQAALKNTEGVVVEYQAMLKHAKTVTASLGTPS